MVTAAVRPRVPPAVCAPAARAHAGFTLIEIMVVVVLIGILATFAVLSMGDRNTSDMADNEARRCMAVLQLAADEAALKNLQLGLRITTEGYEFVTLDDHQRWVDYAADGPLGPHQWPAIMSADLHVEGHLVAPAAPLPVELAQAATPGQSKGSGSSSDSDAASSARLGSAGSGSSADKDSDNGLDLGSDGHTDSNSSKNKRKPQVMLLSSGELTPFSLDLHAKGLVADYHIEGDLTGALKYERRNDGHTGSSSGSSNGSPASGKSS